MQRDPAADARLLRRYADRREEAVLDQLVRRWIPLARHLAGRFTQTSEALEDLHQVACLALVKALKGYDPDRGMAFSTYAVPTIGGELKRHMRDRAWSLRVPRSLQELALRVEAVGERLETELGRGPSVGELASAAKLTDEEVVEAIAARAAFSARSLDAPRREDQATMHETVGETDGGFEAAEHRALLDALLPTVDDERREMLRLRFDHDLTQREIAQRMGVSQMQVSRVLRQTLTALREASETPSRALTAVA